MPRIIEEIEKELYKPLEFEEFSVGTDSNGKTVIENVVECFWDKNEQETSLFMEKVKKHMKNSHMIGFSAFDFSQTSLADAANEAKRNIEGRKTIPQMQGITWGEFSCFVTSDPKKIQKCKEKPYGIYPVLLTSEANQMVVQTNQCLTVPYAVNQNNRFVLQNTATVFSTWLLCLIQGIRFVPGGGNGGILKGARFNKWEESWRNKVAEHIGKIVYVDKTKKAEFLKDIKGAGKDHIPAISDLLYSTKGYEKVVGSMTLERPKNWFLRILSYIFKCLCSYSTKYSNREVFDELIGEGICDIDSYVETETKYFEGYWETLWKDGRGITKSLPLLVNASKNDGFLNDEIIKMQNKLETKIDNANKVLNEKYKSVKKRTLAYILNEEFGKVYNATKEIKKAAREIAWLVFVREKMAELVNKNNLESKLDELNMVLQQLARNVNVNESLEYDENKLLPPLNAVEEFKTSDEINEAAERLNGRWGGKGMLLASVSNRGLNPVAPNNLIANVNFVNPKTERSNEWVFVEGLSNFDVCFLNLS